MEFLGGNMKLILCMSLSLCTSLNVYAGQTIYEYKNDNGSAVITNKKIKTDDTDWAYVNSTYYPDTGISRPLTKEELEKEEIRVYKQQYQKWLKQGGKNSGKSPPTKPIKIVHELTFWPVLYGKLWVGTGLVATDALKINDGFDTNEDCMSNKSYYISVYGKQLNLDIPNYVKVAKPPKKTYVLSCYSTVGPVERSLVP